jgi:tetratricopeptide (TPR) repeat protein
VASRERSLASFFFSASIVALAISSAVSPKITRRLTPSYFAGHIPVENTANGVAARCKVFLGVKLLWAHSDSEGNMTRNNSKRLCIILTTGLILLAGCSRDPNVQKQKALDSGNKYFDAGKFPEACIEYQNAIQIDPKFVAAHEKLADCFLRREMWSAGYSELMRVVDLEPQNFSKHIELGNLLLAGRRAKDAQDRAQLVLAQDPNNVDAHILLANADASLGNNDDALKEIHTAIQLAPDRSISYLNLAQIQIAAKQIPAAEQSFRKAIQLDPKSTAALLMFGDFYSQQRKFAEAEQQFQAVLQIDPKSPAAYRSLAVVYGNWNKKAQAEQILQQAKQAMPDNPDAYRLLGDFYFASGDIPNALNEYASLDKDHPKDLRVRKNYVQLLILSGRLDDAYRLDQELLKQHPKDPDGQVLLGQILRAQNKLSEAQQALEGAITSSPENADAHYALGLVLTQLGDSARGERELREALKLHPGMTDASKALSALAMKKGDFDSLRQSAEAIIAAQPNQPDGYLLEATALGNKGDAQGAYTNLQKAILLAPNDPRAYASLGELYTAQKKFPEAQKNFELALQKNPRSSEGLSGEMRLLLLEKLPARALARIQSQIALAPDYAPFYVLLGQLQLSQKDLTGSEQSLRKATSIDPNSSDAIFLLAQVQQQKGSLDDAKASFELLRQKNPRDPRAYSFLGMIDEAQHDWQQAEEQYKKALDIDPSNAIAANNLAYMLLEHGGNVDVALTYAQTARRGMPDSPNTADTLASVYLRKGNYQLAEDLLNEAVRKSPDNQGYLYHLGLAYQGMKDIPKAKSCFQRALEMNPKSDQADAIRKSLVEVSG